MKLSKNTFQNRMQTSNEQVLTATRKVQEAENKVSNAAAIIRDDARLMQKITDIHYAPAIIHDINTQFENATKLKGKDIVFLFGAAAIQTVRWALAPSLDFNYKPLSPEQRMTSAQGGALEKAAIREYLEKDGFSQAEIAELMAPSHIRNYSWQDLLVAPVPYDAMHGSSRIAIRGFKEAGTEIYGKNHHAATWGHDPVWGWFFGPMNITARMITFRDFQTYHVAQIGNTFNQKITYRTSVGNMIQKSVSCWSEDSKCLFVSAAKQGMHLQSDKYTKGGLPIPFLSPTTAQDLLVKGWNSAEVERLFKKTLRNLGNIGTQFILALTIDQLVKALHLLCYDDTVDGSISTYYVRSEKIVCYSSLISELANGVYVLATKDIGKLDIGGYINLAKNLIHNADFQAKMKAEFLEKELEKKLYGETYYFLEEQS